MELLHSYAPIILHHLLTHFGNYILIAVWIIIAVFFCRLARSTRKSSEEIEAQINSVERSSVNTTIDEYGRIGFLNPALARIVKELAKTLSSLSRGAWWGSILSSIAAILAICQLILGW